MAETTQDIAQAVTNAVSGPGTPDNVTTSRPTKESVWTLYGATIVPAIIGLCVIAALALLAWPEHVANARVWALGIMGGMAVICSPITVIALASSRLGRVEASAGTNHLSIEGRQ